MERLMLICFERYARSTHKDKYDAVLYTVVVALIMIGLAVAYNDVVPAY